MVKRVRLLVGGPMAEWPDDLAAGQLSGPWAAADRGALRLLKLGIVPEVVVGDFDSLTTTERAQVEAQVNQIVTAVPEKDETDTELLLRVVMATWQPELIELYGATGGRLDQLLSNLWIFAQPALAAVAPKVRLIDRSNVVTFYLPGHHEIEQEPGMRYLGFMPLTHVRDLTLYDEKYPLTAWSGQPYSWSSNEFNGPKNHFSFAEGVVAVIQSRDYTGQTGD